MRPWSHLIRFFNKLIGFKNRNGSVSKPGYGLILIMMLMMSTVLIGTSLQMMLGPTSGNFLGEASQDSLSAKHLAESGMETVLTDIQNKLNNSLSVTTAYAYSS